MKYVRREPETVEAVQWFSPADHPNVGWYQHPELHERAVHSLCGRMWADHGWVPPSWADTPGSYFVGEVVCPGDYLIERLSRVKIAPKKSFERLYVEKEDQNAPQPAGEG